MKSIVHARHLSRFARAKAARAAKSNVFCIVKPDDQNVCWVTTINPMKVQRAGPALYSLLCIAADDQAIINDSSVETAARAADEGQTRMHGGNFFMLPTFSNNEPSHATGEFNAQKLRHPGAPVTIYQQELPSGPGSIGSWGVAAMLGGGVGQAVIDRNPNPLQTHATVEHVVNDADSVDVLVPGVYREEWGHIMRQTALESSHGVAVNALGFVAAQAVAEAQRGQFYRANVETSRVVAHARWRNVFLTTTLREAARDLAMLWPAPITTNEFDFVDVQSGRSLGDEAKRTSIRSLFAGEVSVRVDGAPVAALDPTGCLSFW